MAKDMCMATCLLALTLFLFGYAFQSWTTYCAATEAAGSKDPVCVGETIDYKKTEIAMFTSAASLVGLMLVYKLYQDGGSSDLNRFNPFSKFGSSEF
jgi:hypothetical protein